MKKFIIFAFVLLASQALQARERTQADLAKAALSVLQPGASVSKNKAASAPLKVLPQDATLTVMGNDALGFAVLSNDDAWPAVIGYSDAAFQPERNDGLKWFLSTASAAISLPWSPSLRPLGAKAPLITTSAPHSRVASLTPQDVWPQPSHRLCMALSIQCMAQARPR